MHVRTCILYMPAVFKIIHVMPTQFELNLNLRDLPQKQLNLNFSSNDVKWNPKDGELVRCWYRI